MVHSFAYTSSAKLHQKILQSRSVAVHSSSGRRRGWMVGEMKCCCSATRDTDSAAEMWDAIDDSDVIKRCTLMLHGRIADVSEKRLEIGKPVSAVNV